MLGKLDKQKLYNLIIFGMVLAMSLCFADQAWASIIDDVRKRAVAVIEAGKPVVYTLGGFGLICVAWGAIFGKMSWKWFANLAIGLFLIAYMGMLIDYVTRNRNETNTQSQFHTTHIENPGVFGDTIGKQSVLHDSGRFISLKLDEEYYDFEDTVTEWGNQESPDVTDPNTQEPNEEGGDTPPWIGPSIWGGGGNGPSPYFPPQ